MRKRSSSSLFFIFVLIIVLILSACSQGQETQKQTDTPAQSSGEQTEQPAQSTEEPTEQPTTTEEPTTAHEHSFGEWVVVKEADFSSEGVQERSCSCGERELEVIPRKEVSTQDDLFSILGADKWRSVSEYRNPGVACYYFTAKDTGYVGDDGASFKMGFTWSYQDGKIELTFASKQSATMELVNENGIFALTVTSRKNYFVRESEYEDGYAYYHERISDASASTETKHVDIEKDDVKIDLDKSIVLVDGDLKVEIIALIQESANYFDKGRVIQKGVLLRITNQSQRDMDFSMYPIYIGNEAGMIVSHNSFGPLKPGKSKEEHYSFIYNNYNQDELSSLYDLVKVNGIIQIEHYIDEYHLNVEHEYSFDLGNYSNELKTAIDNYVKTH